MCLLKINKECSSTMHLTWYPCVCYAHKRVIKRAMLKFLLDLHENGIRHFQFDIKIIGGQTIFKIRLFKAACISILLNGCESWILTKALIEKLDIFAKTCYRIIQAIKQSREHATNDSLYHLIGQAPLNERQLEFTCHCIRMPSDEPANRFIIYESKIRQSLRPDAPKTKYLNLTRKSPNLLNARNQWHKKDGGEKI